MKHLIILGDGMADTACRELGGRTALEAADTPVLDLLARRGRSGLLHTVPPGYHPGSEIAHLSLLGYDLDKVFEGRGVLEAASMGIPIEDGELAMRCNLICINPDGTIKNHSAGHISSEEAAELIESLNENLKHLGVSFHHGVSYRHLLKIQGGSKQVELTPPHDVPGTPASVVMPRATSPEGVKTAELLSRLIEQSQKILEGHPVNLKRIAEGKDPANSIWPWSAGYRPAMQSMGATYGVKSGKVISAVDLIQGLGVYAGLEPIVVEGATGLYDTNYEGKAAAAVKALDEGADFVFLHIEASDEAGHEGDAELKKKTVEYLDHRVVRPILRWIEDRGEAVAVAVLPDHPTPCSLRTHTADPVPVMIWYPGIEPDKVEKYTEEDCKMGAYGEMKGDEFIRTFLSI